MSNIVNVAWMYPDILNLHGERGNAKAFELVSKKMGVKLNIDTALWCYRISMRYDCNSNVYRLFG